MSTGSSDFDPSGTPSASEQPLDIESLADPGLRARLARAADRLETLVLQLDRSIQELSVELDTLLELAETTIGPDTDWPPLEGPSLSRVSAACGAAVLLLESVVLVGGSPAGVSADRAVELLVRLRGTPTNHPVVES